MSEAVPGPTLGNMKKLADFLKAVRAGREPFPRFRGEVLYLLHGGADVPEEVLEEAEGYLRARGSEVLSVAIVKVAGKADFAFVVKW